jgi:ABC-type nitrate/sulfonate/bicarbonate transport system substrate-binding protein
MTSVSVPTRHSWGWELPAALLLCCALAAGVLSCRRTEDVGTVKIGYQKLALYRHLFVAQEKGFFMEEGVRVELEPVVSANRLVEAVLAGELVGTGLTNLQVAMTVEAKDPGKLKLANMLVWREKSYPDYILVRSGSPVTSLAGLKGRVIGLHPGSAVRAFCLEVLRQAGIAQTDVQLIELDPGVMQSALAAGRVDAIYCMDPEATNLVEKHVGTVLVANPMSLIFPAPVPISGTALSAEFVRQHPSAAAGIVRALDRAIEYTRDPSHAEEVAGYIAEYTGIEASVIARMNPSEYWESTEIDATRVEALGKRFQELGIAGSGVDASALLLGPTP